MTGRLNSVNSTKKMFLFQLSPITSILFIKWFGKLKDIYKKLLLLPPITTSFILHL